MSEHLRHGLTVRVASAPPRSLFAERVVTDEAAITAAPEEDLRVEPLVSEGTRVAQGAPVLRLRRHPEIVATAPMPGRLAEIRLGPGRRLSAMTFFLEPDAGRHRYAVDRVDGDDPGPLRALLQGAGLWLSFRSRPFGRVPLPSERPAAIFVTALDTRPLAPDPQDSVQGDAGALDRGLRALLRLTPGPVFLCRDRAGGSVGRRAMPDRLKVVRFDPVHPLGLAGYHVHALHPATVAHPVWDVQVEDVAGIGALLGAGHVPQTRLVSVAGPALTAARLVRCQPGADLRGLCYGYERPGAHRILSGSALDGREARWLGPRDRQVTVLGAAARAGTRHWLLSALWRAARPMPLIPTAALERAMAGALPTIPFLRALAAGDGETFRRLGGLSLVAEDLALVDYVANADPPVTGLMQAMLRRIAAEEAA